MLFIKCVNYNLFCYSCQSIAIVFLIVAGELCLKKLSLIEVHLLAFTLGTDSVCRIIPDCLHLRQ